ncbi:antitoxin [Streptomyces mangrovisoli]|uniref:Antitoxin n=1 Tax=Streptomyces mangrovisoli TaxID=1428628 RepID=A0A1J4NQU2_9ACTN|nr:antitoxin [Streptomyces mangrovisoli]OIJ64672.1 hypothetical protein WN71_027630 [Streptomyces mangrovisoli]
MGLLHNLKDRLGPAKEKVSDLAQQHGGKIGHGLDKAARMVDDRTKHKYSDKIHAGTGKAKGAVDRLAQKSGNGSGTASGPGGADGHGGMAGGAPEPTDTDTPPPPTS